MSDHRTIYRDMNGCFIVEMNQSFLHDKFSRPMHIWLYCECADLHSQYHLFTLVARTRTYPFHTVVVTIDYDHGRFVITQNKKVLTEYDANYLCGKYLKGLIDERQCCCVVS